MFSIDQTWFQPDFRLESSMSFGGSHWCRPIPRDEHRLMETDEYRSTPVTQHRSTEKIASCAAVRILTHEEFADKHTYPTKPLCIKKSDSDRHHEPATDRQSDSTTDRQDYSSVDRRIPLTYRVQLPKINVAHLNAIRNPSQPSETIADNFRQQPYNAPESMQIDQTSEKRTLRRRK